MENADMNGANLKNANMVATKTANADMTNTETAEVFKSNPKKSKKGIKKSKKGYCTAGAILADFFTLPATRYSATLSTPDLCIPKCSAAARLKSIMRPLT